MDKHQIILNGLVDREEYRLARAYVKTARIMPRSLKDLAKRLGLEDMSQPKRAITRAVKLMGTLLGLGAPGIPLGVLSSLAVLNIGSVPLAFLVYIMFFAFSFKAGYWWGGKIKKFCEGKGANISFCRFHAKIMKLPPEKRIKYLSKWVKGQSDAKLERVYRKLQAA